MALEHKILVSLPALPLVIFENWHFPASLASARGVAGALVAADASRVSGALLLRVSLLSLVSLLGALRWRVPLPRVGSLGAGTTTTAWGVKGVTGVAGDFSLGGGLGWRVLLKLEGLGLWALPPPLPSSLWPSVPLWLAAGMVGTTSVVPAVLPSLCVPSTRLQVHRCVELSRVPVCRAEARLLSCGCFTSCRVKERDKGSFSCSRDADPSVTVIHY